MRTNLEFYSRVLEKFYSRVLEKFYRTQAAVKESSSHGKSESKQLEPKDGGTDHTVVWPSDTI